MIDTNLTGALNAIRAFLPAMIEAAQKDEVADLINVSSIGGKLVFPRYTVYGATKAALTQLSAMLRAELAPLGIRMTGLQPGLTESELAGNVTDTDARAGLEQMFDDIPALTAADIADLIVYLTSRPAHVNISTLDIVPTRQVWQEAGQVPAPEPGRRSTSRARRLSSMGAAKVDMTDLTAGVMTVEDRRPDLPGEPLVEPSRGAWVDRPYEGPRPAVPSGVR